MAKRPANLTCSHPYVRMLKPPDYKIKQDIALFLVPEREAEGWVPDPFPDTRGERYAAIENSHAGRPALVCASGPSAGLLSRSGLRGLVARRNCVVWGTNSVWNVLSGAPLAADYVVILDEPLYSVNLPVLREYFAAHPAARLVTCFGLNEDWDYILLPIELGLTPDQKPDFKPGRYFNGSSSGVAAIQMALHAGCNPIYLVGHDLCAVGAMSHGFGTRHECEVKENYPQKRDMIPAYELLAEHAKQAGVSILNLSPWSAIECFPKVDLDFL